MLSLTFQPDNPTLAPRNEPQVCYVLLNINPHLSTLANRDVNWVLLADASRSMRIPIISEMQFRDLVREGGAQEVLVDGVPVWQLAGPVPSAIKASAPSALDYVAHALHTVIEHMHSSDHFTLIACAEEARILAAHSGSDERTHLTQSISKLRGLRLGDATDLSRGLRLGLDALTQARTHSSASQPSERLLLLTDGFTQQPDACLALARQAAAAGITVSTIGLGGEFQADLLTAMADVTGGRAVLLRNADAIPRAVDDELSAARNVVSRAVTVALTLSTNTTLRHVTRLTPVLAPLETVHSASTYSLHLGDIAHNAPTSLLLEFLAPPAPRRAPSAAATRVRLAKMRVESSGIAVATDDLIVTYTPAATALPPNILDAAARANAVRMQHRAMAAATQGQQAEAAALLRSVATRLHALGEYKLAEVALREASTLAQTGTTSGMGINELRYETRRLGERETRA